MLENLIDDINALRKPTFCSVGTFLNGLGDADRERLDRVLDDEDVKGTDIARALSPHIKVSGQTVSRHRRRGEGNGCGCPQ